MMYQMAKAMCMQAKKKRKTYKVYGLFVGVSINGDAPKWMVYDETCH